MHRTRFGLLLVWICSTASAAGSGSWSEHGTHVFEWRRDWNGLAQYSQEWTQARPHDANAWYSLGTAYLSRLHQPREALAPLQRATQLKPNWGAAWTALGVAYLELHRYAEAVQAFEQPAAIAATDPAYWNHLAAAYAGANRTDLAEHALDCEQDQASRWANNIDWYVLGNAYASIGRLDKAIAAYRHSLYLDEHVAEAWNNLGVAEEASGNGAEALLSYQRAEALGDHLGAANVERFQSAQTMRAGNAQSHPWPTEGSSELFNPFGRPGWRPATS